MKIVVYTLTRDRLWSTTPCFASLREKAGAPFIHLVIDNGSQDATVDWLRRMYKPDELIALPENVGISRASNLALDVIFKKHPDVDLIVKMDNDCLIESENILLHVTKLSAELFKPFSSRWVVSPRVEGIVNQPVRVRSFWTANYSIGVTSIVGGLFHVVPAAIYRDYRYPESLPLAWGQDDDFCQYVRFNGGRVGYVENLVVQHYLGTHGQSEKDKAYFERKHKEEVVRE